MAIETVKIENLLPWSEAKRVETKNGPRMLRTAPPGDVFWNAWRNSKETLRAAGISVGKDRRGNWEACWWMPLEATEQQKIETAQAESRATDADISIPCPQGLTYLGYQKAGIAYALNRTNILIGDEMGLGKTIQAIGLINADESIKKVLVICPASLRLNWKREIEKWAVRPLRVAVVNGGKPSDLPIVGSWDVLVVNYDVLAKHRKWLDCLQFDLMIADECHYMKNPKAARTKAVLGAVSKGKRTAEAIQARRKVFLTGTPIVNRPIELWPLVKALDPTDMGKNFFGFASRYCDAKQTKWGWDFSGASRLDELQRKLREKFMVRRLKADVLTELPPKRRQVIEIPANGASAFVKAERAIFDQHSAYIEELEARLHEAELEAAYDLQHEDPETVRALLHKARSIAFEEMSKARHETALAKVPHVIEHLRDCLEEGAVVCFAHHKDVVAQIKEAFPEAVVITGDVSMENRQKAVDDFQSGKSNLFIGNIQAAGVGITLTRSHHVVFAELDWVPGNLTQAEDRTHRIGQKDSVLVQHIVLEDSVDSIMVKKILAKQEVIDKALDSKVEIQFGSPGSAGEVDVTKPVEVEIKPDRIDQEAASIDPAKIPLILQGLRMLAGVCDGAREIDGAGFNKFDTRIGKELAGKDTLSPRQAVLGRKLVNKYRRQLPVALVEAIR